MEKSLEDDRNLNGEFQTEKVRKWRKSEKVRKRESETNE